METASLIASPEKLTVLSAGEVFHKDSGEHKEYFEAAGPDSRVFYAYVKEIDDNGRWGNVTELDLSKTTDDVTNLSFGAACIDAEFKDGTNRVFTLDEWRLLDDSERGRITGTDI